MFQAAKLRNLLAKGAILHNARESVYIPPKMTAITWYPRLSITSEVWFRTMNALAQGEGDRGDLIMVNPTGEIQFSQITHE